MSCNLLEKESEYRKMNDELQKQNKKLMEEFDNVMVNKNLVYKIVSFILIFDFRKNRTVY